MPDTCRHCHLPITKPFVIWRHSATSLISCRGRTTYAEPAPKETNR